MNDLQTTVSNLPTQPEELARFVLVGIEKAKAIRAEIRAIQKLNLANEVWKQKKKELEVVNEAVLEAERRIGVLFNNMPKASGGDRRSEVFKVAVDDHFENTGSAPANTTRRQAAEKMGFSPRTVRKFQQMARHPEAIEQAKAEALETGKDLTVDGVLSLVRYKEQKADADYYRSLEDEQQHDLYHKAMLALRKIPDDPAAWMAIARSELTPSLERDFLSKEIKKLQGILAAFTKEGDRTW